MKKFYLFAGLWTALFSASAQNVADFENIQLDSSSYWNGSDGAGGFESGGFWFPNDYNADWGSWSGFSVSNMQDSITAGWGNQYSAITAIGAEQSENYAVVYASGGQEITFDTPVKLDGFYVTNDTYTYFSMKNGDDFSKKFGGADGTDPDYLKLIIYGIDGDGNKLDSVDFFLADFRFEDSEQDYIVNDWQWVDLSGLGTVAGIKFEMESTDTGDFGMNTPAYFCMDNFSGSTIVSANIIPDNSIKIYPNPVKSSFYIDSANKITDIVLTDNTGKIIARQQLSGEKNVKISVLEQFPKGLYLLKIKIDKEILCRKIIKI